MTEPLLTRHFQQKENHLTQNISLKLITKQDQRSRKKYMTGEEWDKIKLISLDKAVVSKCTFTQLQASILIIINFLPF